MISGSDLELQDNPFAELVDVFLIGFDPVETSVIRPRRDPARR
jgi:hypothetical protein